MTTTLTENRRRRIITLLCDLYYLTIPLGQVNTTCPAIARAYHQAMRILTHPFCPPSPTSAKTIHTALTTLAAAVKTQWPSIYNHNNLAHQVTAALKHLIPNP